MIGNPHPKELTQGTIFTCALAEEYPGIPVLGIIITARCDVSHGKAPIFSYVPLVKFEDWLLQDGRRVLAGRCMAAARATMKAAVVEAKLTPSILETVSHAAISAELGKSADKGGLATAKRFDEALVVLSKAESAIMDVVSVDESKKFISDNQKTYNQMASEVLSGLMSDFYYIDRSEIGEQCLGYVALLREIRSVPALLARALLTGIDVSQFVDLCCKHSTLENKLAITSNDHYAMPVGLMLSPFIEHFMQRLTHLFSRIGVTDFPPEKLKGLRAMVPFALDKEI